jgi:hypothetical protein
MELLENSKSRYSSMTNTSESLIPEISNGSSSLSKQNFSPSNFPLYKLNLIIF